MSMSVVLSGCSGSGKSTLCDELIKRRGLRPIKFETRPIMPDGIKTHRDVINASVLDPDTVTEFQHKLVKGRAKLFAQESKVGGFISDRAVIDSYVYYSMHNAVNDSVENQNDLLNQSMSSLTAAHLTVLCVPNNPVNNTDPVRIDAPSYHRAYNAILVNVSYEAFRKEFKDTMMHPFTFFTPGDEDPYHSPQHTLLVSSTGHGMLRFNEEESMLSVEHRAHIIEQALEFLLSVSSSHSKLNSYSS